MLKQSLVIVLSCLLGASLFAVPSVAAIVTGKITSIEGRYLELDIGAGKGVKIGDAGRVYYEVTIDAKKKPVYIANVTITHISPKTSMAKIEGETTGEIKKGYLVELTLQAVKKKPPPKKVVKKEPKAGEVWKDPHLGMEFVWVPGGCYEMGDLWGDGSNDERPVHTVCVDGFWIGRYEVTQGKWKRLMRDNPSHFKDCGDNCPVERVSWNEAVEFARRLSQKTGHTFRLPTEAEWEYVCRSGGKKEKYSGSGNADAVAWYDSNSGKRTHPVGQKRSNGLGIYDMSGNVWEWCGDWFASTYYNGSLRDNPQGPSS